MITDEYLGVCQGFLETTVRQAFSGGLQVEAFRFDENLDGNVSRTEFVNALDELTHWREAPAVGKSKVRL